MKFRVILISILLCLLTSAAKAQQPVLSCPALHSADTYVKPFDQYKYLIEGNDGWMFRTGLDFRQHFELDPAGVRLMQQLQENLEKQGVTLVVLYPPTRGMVAYNHIKPEDAAAFNFPSLDAAWSEYEATIATMRQAGVHFVGIPRAKAEGKDFFYMRDHHWNASGAKISADEVAAYIKALPAYRGIEKGPFKNAPKETAEYKSAWAKILKEICKTDLPPTQIIHFQTMREDQYVTAEALFGDAAEPQIVLAGTSNSTAQEPSFANFEGFLKESLSADILNFSLVGAGIDSAFFEWAASDNKKSGRTKIMIWEIPGYYEFKKQKNILRQIIPAVSGDCGASAVKSVSNVAFSGNSVALFQGLEAEKISGDGYYIYMKFSTPPKQSFTVKSVFAKDNDTVKILRKRRVKDFDEYSVLLRNWKKGELQSVSLASSAPMNDVVVSAKICKLP